jgi:hypothetical protein
MAGGGPILGKIRLPTSWGQDMSTDDTQPARPSAPYDRSKEPRTIRIDPATYQPPSAPPRQGGNSGWPEQPPQSGGGQYGGSGSGGQYGSAGNTASFGSEPGYTAEAGYGSQPGYNSPGYGGQSSAPPPASGRKPRRRRRHRAITMTVFVVIVLLILAVIGDQVGKAVAENQFASQVTSADPQIHPSISIKEPLPGDPFLKQIITHDLTEVDISASNIPVPAGPVTLMITSVSAVAKGLHINSSFSGGKVDTVNATVFISYSSLSSTLSSQTSGIANLTLSSAGNGEIKADFGIAGTSLLSETGKITLKGNQVSIVFTGGGSGGDNGGIGGIIGSITGSGGSGGASLPNLSFTIPKLPAGVAITSFSVGSQGITVMGSARNQSLSQ